MFSRTIRLKPLAQACRGLGITLGAGVDVKKALDMAAQKSSDPRARAAFAEVAQSVRYGTDMTTAMKAQGDRFPELFIDMVEVAERTGTLPEVLRKLSDHYDNSLRIKRDFYHAITWPAVQLIAAIIVIGLLIFLLGWIADTRASGSESWDPLGLGLMGEEGAIIWFSMTFGTLAAVIIAWKFIGSNLNHRKAIDPVLLNIPVVGNCMRSFAIARFSWAYALTQQAGMEMKSALTASLRATSNGAFVSRTGRIWKRLTEGDPLARALEASGLFPDDYIQIVDVAETSGTVPEALDRLSPDFEDQARRSLNVMVAVLSWAIWGIVATFIVIFVFRIILSYIALINDLLP